MNDEIKEILDKIQNVVNHKEASYNALVETKAEDYKLLLDYITNLQQDNEMYAQLKDEYEEEIKELQQENERLKELNENASKVCMAEHKYGVDKAEEARDYKSRCEKAIEYNNQLIKDTKDFYRPTTDIIYSGDCLIDIAKNNINILQNGSEKDDR